MPRPTEDEFEFTGLLDTPAYDMFGEDDNPLYSSRPGRLAGADRLRLRRRTLYFQERIKQFEENESTGIL